MPTENRRVATYLPKEIDDCLATFKAERGLNGDSPALIAILSEFFGVSQKVAHSVDYIDSKITERLETLELKVSHLKEELLGELRSELLKSINSVERTKAEVKDELLSELRSELPTNNEVPGQLELITEHQQTSELLSELTSELSAKSSSNKLEPLPGTLLSRRFGIHDNSANNKKNTLKNNPEKFVAWSKSKDPDGIAWEYREDSKLYHPILESAISPDQVNPIAAQRSERSGEG